MASKRTPTLKFNKNLSVDDNMKVFDKYILKLEKEFGKILISHINDPINTIRDNVKSDVFDLINLNG